MPHITIEHRAKPLTGQYTVRGTEVTVTSREYGQLSGKSRLLSPSQVALVLLVKMALVAEEIGAR